MSDPRYDEPYETAHHVHPIDWRCEKTQCDEGKRQKESDNRKSYETPTDSETFSNLGLDILPQGEPSPDYQPFDVVSGELVWRYSLPLVKVPVQTQYKYEESIPQYSWANDDLLLVYFEERSKEKTLCQFGPHVCLCNCKLGFGTSNIRLQISHCIVAMEWNPVESHPKQAEVIRNQPGENPDQKAQRNESKKSCASRFHLRPRGKERIRHNPSQHARQKGLEEERKTCWQGKWHSLRSSALGPAGAGGFAGDLSALVVGQFSQPGLAALAADGGEELTHSLRGSAHTPDCT
jgi:hypothetical protein